MVANGTAPVVPQSTEGSSFEPSVRKKALQKVGTTCTILLDLLSCLVFDFR